MAKKYELDIRDYARILRRRKTIFIFTVLMLGIFSFMTATLQKPTPLYSASSSVKIDKSSTMAGLYLESISYGEGDTLQTQATIIRSYPIMEIVAKRLGLLDEKLTSDEIRQNNKYLDVVLNLKEKVTTEQEGATNIINITVTSDDAGFCQMAANVIAEVFKEQNIYEKNKRAISARQFIEEQLKLVSAKLKESEENVKKFREENKLVSLPDQSRIILDQLTKSETQYNELTKSLSEMDLMAKQLKELKAIPTEILGGAVAERVGPIFQRLNTQLLDLNIKKDSLLLLYTEKHPEVRDVNEQITNVTKNMLSQLTAQKNTMQRSVDSLKTEMEKFREQLTMVPESGLQLARLERDVLLNTQVYTLLEQKHQESLIKEAEKVEEVSIVKPALKPASPINPTKTGSITFIGILLGVILGLVFAFISETMDTSIGTIEDVEAYLEIPVIGIIPFIGVEEIRDILLKKEKIEQSDEALQRNARLITHFAPKSTIAESYRALRTNIQFTCLEKEAKVILFSSSSPGEGKSSTVTNLAMVMAQAGNKTLLIDADLRKPVINKIFGIDREPGLSDVILGNYEWEEVKRTVTDIMMGKMGMEDIISTPGIDNLNIITAGAIPPNPAEIVSSSKVAALISQFKSKYDVILIDTTPILPATDAAILGSKADGVVIVYQVGKIARGALKRAKIHMDNVKAKVLGVVLNGLKPELSIDYHAYRYQSYYSYGAERAEKKKKSWIPMPSFIKKLFYGEKHKGKGAEVKKKSSAAAEILKILTLVLSISFMLFGIFYEADYKRSHEKGIPVVSVGESPSGITGGPETGAGGVAAEERELLSIKNISIALIIAALLIVVAILSTILIRKRPAVSGGEPKEGITAPPEKEAAAEEPAPALKEESKDAFNIPSFEEPPPLVKTEEIKTMLEAEPDIKVEVAEALSELPQEFLPAEEEIVPQETSSVSSEIGAEVKEDWSEIHEGAGETVIGSNFKGFGITEETEEKEEASPALKEELMDFSSLGEESIFEKSSSATKEDFTSEAKIKEETSHKDTEEDKKEEEKKPPEEQIKDWEKLLLID